MESILQMAQNATINPFGNLVQDFQGAQTNAINNQRGRMQNEQMARQMESAQRLLGIAPQLAESIKASGAPFAEQYGLLVEADPTEAPNILNQMMGFEKANLKNIALQNPQVRFLVEDLKDEYMAIEEVRQKLIAPNLPKAQFDEEFKKYQALYSAISSARAQIAQITGNASLAEILMPKVKNPVEFAIDVQNQGLKVESGKRSDKSLENEEKRLNLQMAEYGIKLKEIEKKAKGDIDDRIWKALDKNNLLAPEAYDSSIEMLDTAYQMDSPFAIAKLLSQVIEPGLSVTEGEAGNYVVGGQGAFAKFVNDKVGTSGTNLKRLIDLAKEFIRIKKSQAQRIVDQKGDVFGTRKDENKSKSSGAKKSVKDLPRF
jgi:hypothetical protein